MPKVIKTDQKSPRYPIINLHPPIQIPPNSMHRINPPSASRPTADTQKDSDRQKCPISTHLVNQRLLLIADAAAELDAELDHHSAIPAYESVEKRALHARS